MKGLNISKFKKVAESEHSTTLQHPAGHLITIAHKSVAPAMQKQLSSLPLEGAPAKPPTEKADSAIGKMAKDSAPMAEGGEVDPNSKMGKFFKGTREAINGTPAAPTPPPPVAPERFAYGTPDAPIGETPQVEDDPVVSDADAQKALDQAYAEANAPEKEALTAPKGEKAAKEAVAIDDRSPRLPASADLPPPPASVTGISGSTGPMRTPSSVGVTGATGEISAPPPPAAATHQPLTAANPAQAPTLTAPESGNNALSTGIGVSQDMSQAGNLNSMEGYKEKADAIQQLGERQAAVEQQAIRAKAINQQNYTNSYNQLDQQRKALMDDINNQHIDPNRFMGSMTTSSRIASAIGLIASGMGSAMSGQPNLAADFIHKQIENDINAQKSDLGKKENLLSANMRQFGNLKDAIDMTRLNLNDITISKLAKAQAMAQGPLAQSAYKDTLGILQREQSTIQGGFAMKQAIFAGVKAGTVPPSVAIMAMPDNEQKEAREQLAKASEAYQLRDNLISAFDKIAAANTLHNRVMNPVEASKIIQSATGMTLPELSKATAGKYTESDAAAIGHTISTLGSSKKAFASQRQDFVNLASKGLTKDSFPLLGPRGLDPRDKARYDEYGNSRIPETKHKR